VNEIRADILKWVSEGGAQGLRFPVGVTQAIYLSSMPQVLAPHAVVIGFVTNHQESDTTDSDLKVSVNGQPKTCRGFVSVKDQRPHILCNLERFVSTADSQQYRLIHHEYAGLAGVERNEGASSDYVISSQITDFLVPETVLRLSVKKPSPVMPPCSDNRCKPEHFVGGYTLLSQAEGSRCEASLKLRMGMGLDTVVFQSTEYGIDKKIENEQDYTKSYSEYRQASEVEGDMYRWVKSGQSDRLVLMHRLAGRFPREWPFTTVSEGSFVFRFTKENNMQLITYDSKRVVQNCLYSRTQAQ